MRKKRSNSDDIERAVYDGMQDLRVPRPAAKARQRGKPKAKKKKK